MSIRPRYLSQLGLWIGITSLPAAFLEGERWLAGATWAWKSLTARWMFILIVLILDYLVSPRYESKGKNLWTRFEMGIVFLSIATGVVYALSQTTWSAWIAVGLLYVLFLRLEQKLTANQNLLRQWTWRGVLAAGAGGLPIALAQWESNFADEEFFIALQAMVLALFWLLLLLTSRICATRGTKKNIPTSTIQVARRPVAIALLLLLFAGAMGTTRNYRHSFYPVNAPTYQGISRATPFLCGTLPQDSQTYDGAEVFQRLLARVEAKTRKGAPEYGMLALATGDTQWAAGFHKSLLTEVTENRFTQPAHSVKSIQYEASLRAYYYPRVRKAFPGLFSEEEDKSIRAWFAAINRRAMTVEWVDLMYGLAFSKWPEGLYENQENGAGLLSLLETGGLADPAYTYANRRYLDHNKRGWDARFRVTDDALIYQPEWIYNAYFQSLYWGSLPEKNAQLSMEWLLTQALPDGSPFGYNHPASPSLAGIAYAAANWLGDPQYIWLAGRAVETSERLGRPLPASPGAEKLVNMEGRSPVLGSCLLYGDSGLPNQVGPLAPDKVVFRDGWSPEAAYLLLNLRFSGWHRYKATNAITLLYQGTPLVIGSMTGESFGWLPKGRSLFRDKRIPRENLNGLVMEKTGMEAVLYGLTSVGGPWAQDPPYYAEVIAFKTGEEVDWVHTRISNWRGWQHDRWIYFYHQGGPIVVVDSADGTSSSKASLMWHLAGEANITEEQGKIHAQWRESHAETFLLPQAEQGKPLVVESENSLGKRIAYSSSDGQIWLTSVFLLGKWTGAKVELEQDDQLTLLIEGAERKLALPLAGENR